MLRTNKRFYYDTKVNINFIIIIIINIILFILALVRYGKIVDLRTQSFLTWKIHKWQISTILPDLVIAQVRTYPSRIVLRSFSTAQFEIRTARDPIYIHFE